MDLSTLIAGAIIVIVLILLLTGIGHGSDF